METTAKKLKLIYLPFLVISISYNIIYILMSWMHFASSDSLSPRSEMFEFWLPLILPWIPLLLWLRPKLKLLKIVGNRPRPMFFFLLVAALSMIIPTLIAQSYMEKATGTITNLKDINQVDQKEKSRYYTIEKYFIDKNNIGAHSSFLQGEGQNSNAIHMFFYIAAPILANESDTAATTCKGWLGFTYSETIDNRLPNDEKQEKYEAFVNDSYNKFVNTDLSKFSYLERVTYRGLEGFNNAKSKCEKYSSGNAPVFQSVNEPFQERTGSLFTWIFGAYGIAALLLFVMIVLKFDDEDQEQITENEQQIKRTDIKEAIALFKPREGYFITPIIIYINLAVFLLMVISGLGFLSFKTQDLIAIGANFRPLTTNGEWWRLLTCTFLHGGLPHLFANMYGLLFVGQFLEPVIGKAKYILVYLITGILASLASLWWHDEAVVSVGASGAIFGLFGLFLGLLLMEVYPREKSKGLLKATSIFIGYNLIFGLTGNIDNAAHIGGLVSGLVSSIVLYTMTDIKKKAVDEAAVFNQEQVEK